MLSLWKPVNLPASAIKENQKTNWQGKPKNKQKWKTTNDIKTNEDTNQEVPRNIML
jgi:hypothetical protein